MKSIIQASLSRVMCAIALLTLSGAASLRAADSPVATPATTNAPAKPAHSPRVAALYKLPPTNSPPVQPVSDDNTGFVPIFDGKTLDGWDGNPAYWRVENGELVGEVTPATLLKRNTFIIWRGGEPRDFELKAEYKISARGNSGINYRSVELTDAKWSMSGYQSDIEGPNRWTGQNYEERGREFLALRGQITRVGEGGEPIVVGQVGDPAGLQSYIKKEDWNQYHLIIRGNTLIHILNGHVMCVVIDDDTKNRRFDGKIGVQVHVGPPMKVEYRNILLKTL